MVRVRLMCVGRSRSWNRFGVPFSAASTSSRSIGLSPPIELGSRSSTSPQSSGTDLADGTCSAAARLGDDLLPRGDCVGSEVWRSLEAKVQGKLTLPIGADRGVHEVTADYLPVEHHAGRKVVRA